MCRCGSVTFLSILWFAFSCITGRNDTTMFDNFIDKYQKSYGNDTAEYWIRFQIFEENLLLHAKLNAERNHSSSAFYGITKFSDLTPEEFSAQYLASYKPGTNYEKIPSNFNIIAATTQAQELPNRKDWRDSNAVTSVKNQGSCGACWAFSTVAAVESMYAIQHGKLSSLSTQEVIDCSYDYKHWLRGCEGGELCTALEWMEGYSLVSEASYPTKNKLGTCKTNNHTEGVRAKGHNCYNLQINEDLLTRLLATHGPVAVSVDATSWNNYQGGIIQYHCGSMVNNHAVEIVGYDKSGDIPYYIVKNSWGKDFGHAGYLYVMMGSNVCGIADEVATVDV